MLYELSELSTTQEKDNIFPIFDWIEVYRVPLWINIAILECKIMFSLPIKYIFWEYGCNITWWLYLYYIYYILYFNITLYLTIFLRVWIWIQWCILFQNLNTFEDRVLNFAYSMQFQNLNKGVYCILYSEYTKFQNLSVN